MVTEAVCQETQVVIITGEVGAVLILNLWKHLERRMKKRQRTLSIPGNSSSHTQNTPSIQEGRQGEIQPELVWSA